MQPRNRDAGGLRGLRRIETTQEQPVFVRCGGGKRRTAVRGIRFVYLAPGRRLVQDRRPSRPILQDIPLPAIVCNLTTGKKGVYTPADRAELEQLCAALSRRRTPVSLSGSHRAPSHASTPPLTSQVDFAPRSSPSSSAFFEGSGRRWHPSGRRSPWTGRPIQKPQAAPPQWSREEGARDRSVSTGVSSDERGERCWREPSRTGAQHSSIWCGLSTRISGPHSVVTSAG